MIQCGRHLVRSTHGWLLFEASETKNKKPFGVPFPVELVPNLDHYLDVHRPVLLDVGRRNGRPPTEALWVSAFGGAMTYSSIGLQVRGDARCGLWQSA